MTLLDTNVISESIKITPDTGVLLWLKSQPKSSLFTTSITQAEILYGIALLPKGKRKNRLITFSQKLFNDGFGGRILSFDTDTAQICADIVSGRRKSGKPISHSDAQIAAIARSKGAAIATRNIKDFEGCGIGLINPWEE